LKKLGVKQHFALRDTSKDYAAIIAATFEQGHWRLAIWCSGGYSLARASQAVSNVGGALQGDAHRQARLALLETAEGVPVGNPWNIAHLRKFYP
jgi:hypothetical protein